MLAVTCRCALHRGLLRADARRLRPQRAHADAAARAGPSRGDPRAPARPVVRGCRGVLRRVHGPARREHRHGGLPRAAASVRRRARRRPVGVARLTCSCSPRCSCRPAAGRTGPAASSCTCTGSSCSRVPRRVRARALARRADRAARGPGRWARRCCRRTAWRSSSPACRADPPGRARRAGGGAGGRPGVRPGDRRPARGGGGLALGLLPERPRRGCSPSWPAFTCCPGPGGLPGSFRLRPAPAARPRPASGRRRASPGEQNGGDEGDPAGTVLLGVTTTAACSPSPPCPGWRARLVGGGVRRRRGAHGSGPARARAPRRGADA